MDSNKGAGMFSSMDSNKRKYRVMKKVQKKVTSSCDKLWMNLRVHTRNMVEHKIEMKVSGKVTNQMVELTTNKLADQVRRQVWYHVAQNMNLWRI
jgi:hypothetical protein